MLEVAILFPPVELLTAVFLQFCHFLTIFFCAPSPALCATAHGLSMDTQYFPFHSTNIHRYFCFANCQKPSKAIKSRWRKITNGMMGRFPLLRHDNRRAAFAELKAKN
jgi:hypothetical protein